MIVFAIVSILAVGAFLAYGARLSIHAMLAKRRGTPAKQIKRSFFQTHLGAYTVSLLLGNFMSSIAFILNAHWVAVGGIEMSA